MGVRPRGSAPQCGPSGLQMAWQSLIVVANIAGFPSLPRHGEDKALGQLGRAKQLALNFVSSRLKHLKPTCNPSAPFPLPRCILKFHADVLRSGDQSGLETWRVTALESLLDPQGTLHK